MIQPSPEWLTALQGFEGGCSWPYLDTAGKVTVAYGPMCPSLQHFINLPWLGDVDAAAGWLALVASRSGMIASYYQTVTKLRLSPESMTAILTQDVGECVVEVAHLFPWLAERCDSIPQGPQNAFLDMAYDMGAADIAHKFPRFISFFYAGNWESAAEQCFREGLNDTPERPGARNSWTKAQILSAVETPVPLQ
jgi:GH24 family phage-related lysozyme (muramidase)